MLHFYSMLMKTSEWKVAERFSLLLLRFLILSSVLYNRDNDETTELTHELKLDN